ncbi:methyltransferase domain-containing protein [Streptomyces sp. HUCO-GS316]|uniref:class I SAM-dependent methyltransferase n=1 Tax=Streptomyces sp. HUCO-GS316 TaxID=2692198 RepID=UPI00136FE8FE|nr:class I SAM-dependent methyltransferase [Streptomyces sp. HUCO-GS316]MXM67067.1 methyltransferase domain-containing protein [Streptomyces sp. HUCO-GS316]
MPYSDAEGKGTAAAWYREIQPGTVIDVGAGSGTYAQELREAPWAGRWTAVEAWEPYVTRFGLHGLYDAVVVADARHLVAPFYRADLVIAGDVLEHMPRPDAVRLLQKVRANAANLIVSVPVLHLEQGAVYGNPYETHVDHWTADGMRAELARSGTLRGELVGDVLAYFWWSR